jgi:hypothetical protein
MKSIKIDIPEGYVVDENNSSFENIIFKKKPSEITDRVKTVEDACKELGEHDSEVRTLRQLESITSLSKSVVDSQKLVVVIKALNEGWYPDWDKDDYKYYPYFTMRGGQVFRDVSIWSTRTNVPAPSLLKSSELVRYITSQFLDLYRSVYA